MFNSDNKIKAIENSIAELRGNINVIIGQNVGNNSKIMNDLLIKIAKLEGLSDAMEHRRKSSEILDRLNSITEEMLKNDREDKNIDNLKEKINLLKWVLGE